MRYADRDGNIYEEENGQDRFASLDVYNYGRTSQSKSINQTLGIQTEGELS